MGCCSFGETVNELFTDAKARLELDRYRRKGPRPTTRLLLDGLARAGAAEGTLLDIGGGVGALTFELLDRGARKATIVEASAGYAAAASEEIARRGRAGDIALVRGDFLDVAGTIPAASVVTLDRVICCYPLYEPLLNESLRHATRVLALSYPRDRWYVRSLIAVENLLRRRKTKFRSFVHRETRIRDVIASAGFELISHAQTVMWSNDVFVRRTARTA